MKFKTLKHIETRFLSAVYLAIKVAVADLIKRGIICDKKQGNPTQILANSVSVRNFPKVKFFYQLTIIIMIVYFSCTCTAAHKNISLEWVCTGVHCAAYIHHL